MLEKEFLEKFSQITLKMGVNLQKDQGLLIVCPVEKHHVAEALCETAYKMGAGTVTVRWECESIERLNYLHDSQRYLTQVPQWVVKSREYLLQENFCYVAISAEDPNCFNGVPADRINKAVQARSKALKKFSDKVMANAIRWCVVSVPTLNWAKTVFPDSPSPQEDLLDAIAKTMRLDGENPLLEWEKHVDNLQRRSKILNDCNFSYLHFTSSSGTDLKVGLADGHNWLSAKEKAQDGLEFIANLPTEEIFTAPHRLRVDGKVYSAKPLVYNGSVIDNFCLTFKDGKVTDYNAERGYQTLKELLDTDQGVLRLGEVALIGKNSPIAQSGILFYNTLFDENASCHLAFGKGYPTTINNSDNMTRQQLKEAGLNDSIEHVDFMIGTCDLKVVGVNKDGSQTTLFLDGDWVI